MWIHLFILGISFGLAIAYNVDMAVLYRQLVSYMAGDHLMVFGQVFAGGVIFVLSSLLMERLGLFSLMRLLAQLLMELSLFLLTAIALFALFCSSTMGENLWAAMHSLIILPFIGLGTGMLTLYLFDFNYPSTSRPLPVLFLMAISFGLVSSGVL